MKKPGVKTFLLYGRCMCVIRRTVCQVLLVDEASVNMPVPGAIPGLTSDPGLQAYQGRTIT